VEREKGENRLEGEKDRRFELVNENTKEDGVRSGGEWVKSGGVKLENGFS